MTPTVKGPPIVSDVNTGTRRERPDASASAHSGSSADVHVCARRRHRPMCTTPNITGPRDATTPPRYTAKSSVEIGTRRGLDDGGGIGRDQAHATASRLPSTVTSASSL